jgi:signal transduction histidine kinase
MMTFTIEDQGVGIPKDEQSKVFERFESHSLGSGHRGAGLGLSIVKSLVELHGGTVSLESEPGHGTRVTVRLPVEGRPDKAKPSLPQEGPEAPLSAGGSHA